MIVGTSGPSSSSSSLLRRSNSVCRGFDQIPFQVLFRKPVARAPFGWAHKLFALAFPGLAERGKTERNQGVVGGSSAIQVGHHISGRAGTLL